jgi:hypothetical protein
MMFWAVRVEDILVGRLRGSVPGYSYFGISNFPKKVFSSFLLFFVLFLFFWFSLARTKFIKDLLSPIVHIFHDLFILLGPGEATKATTVHLAIFVHLFHRLAKLVTSERLHVTTHEALLFLILRKRNELLNGVFFFLERAMRTDIGCLKPCSWSDLLSTVFAEDVNGVGRHFWMGRQERVTVL